MNDLKLEYEQFKNNNKFIESENFKENTKNMVFSVLNDGEKEELNKEKINYFTEDELLLKLSEDNLNTLLYIRDNPYSIEKIDNPFKDILLLITNKLASNGDFAILNFAYDLFKEKGNYKKLYSKLGNITLFTIEEMLIYFYLRKINTEIEIKTDDFAYYSYLIEQNIIDGNIEKKGNKLYMKVKNTELLGLSSKQYMRDFLIYYPEFFGDKKKYNIFKTALEVKNNNNYDGLLDIIYNPNNTNLIMMEALEKLINEYSDIEEVSEYLYFISSKSNEQLKGNYLWKLFLNEVSKKILEYDRDKIGKLIKLTMDMTIDSEQKAKG